MKKCKTTQKNHKFTRLFQGLFVTFLGSLAFMLTGCYAPMDPVAMYAPIEYYSKYSVSGHVSDKEMNPVENAAIKLSHTVDGEECKHDTSTNEAGSYFVSLKCLDDGFEGDHRVVIEVMAESYETTSRTIFITRESERRGNRNNFELDSLGK